MPFEHIPGFALNLSTLRPRKQRPLSGLYSVELVHHAYFLEDLPTTGNFNFQKHEFRGSW